MASGFSNKWSLVNNNPLLVSAALCPSSLFSVMLSVHGAGRRGKLCVEPTAIKGLRSTCKKNIGVFGYSCSSHIGDHLFSSSVLCIFIHHAHHLHVHPHCIHRLPLRSSSFSLTSQLHDQHPVPDIPRIFLPYACPNHLSLSSLIFVTLQSFCIYLR